MKIPSAINAPSSPIREGSRYPAPHNSPCMGRTKNILGNAFGLDQFGVNLVTIQPGSWSSQRHWHECEDEFIYVLEGTITLLDDAGEHALTPGMCAGFKAGNGNGHCLKNLSENPVVYLEVGSRLPGEKVIYSDIDMKGEEVNGVFTYLHKDGRPM